MNFANIIFFSFYLAQKLTDILTDGNAGAATQLITQNDDYKQLSETATEPATVAGPIEATAEDSGIQTAGESPPKRHSDSVEAIQSDGNYKNGKNQSKWAILIVYFFVFFFLHFLLVFLYSNRSWPIVDCMERSQYWNCATDRREGNRTRRNSWSICSRHRVAADADYRCRAGYISQKIFFLGFLF